MTMTMANTILVALLALAACGSPPAVKLTEAWPSSVDSYDDVTTTWTRRTTLRGEFQEALDLVATFKSADWRATHASRDADHRGLTGEARSQRFAQAQAEMAGPYEVELLVTTWDRRENDLDRGQKSVWHVVLVDEQGHEIAPLEIVKDKRPSYTLRAEFPALGDFATALVVIARFPRTSPLVRSERPCHPPPAGMSERARRRRAWSGPRRSYGFFGGGIGSPAATRAACCGRTPRSQNFGGW